MLYIEHTDRVDRQENSLKESFQKRDKERCFRSRRDRNILLSQWPLSAIPFILLQQICRVNFASYYINQ